MGHQSTRTYAGFTSREGRRALPLRAGPTGGAGRAWPAGICSLIWLTTFLAIGNSVECEPRHRVARTVGWYLDLKPLRERALKEAMTA